MLISIHTSAKEVTDGVWGWAYGGAISIHTSAKEVTWNHLLFYLILRFQSTLPRRKWPLHFYFLEHSSPISIHTSAKEVTWLTSYFSSILPDFNPHFREGSDNYLPELSVCFAISIHTSAKEVTKHGLWDLMFQWFQSTLPRRKWQQTCTIFPINIVSFYQILTLFD